MNERSSAGEGFYGLSLAAQMIVWAIRKRLHLLSRGDDDSEVSTAFRTAGLSGLHAALMSIIDVLLCSGATRIQLHAVGCPCLAPHERSLLSALAHLQNDEQTEARRRIGDLMCPASMRLTLPCMHVIVRDLDARGMRLDPAEALQHFTSEPFRGAVH